MSSNYPGDEPGRDEQAPHEEHEDQDGREAPEHGEPGPGTSPEPGQAPYDEHTQPLGYWERQAAEQAARESASGQARRAPDDAAGSDRPYPPPPPPGAGQPYPPPFAGGPYAGGPYAGGPYAGAPGQPPYGAWGQGVPDHPQSTLALVLGLVGLIGGFLLCGLGFLASPFAWAIGRNAVKEIETSGGRIGGVSAARTGMVLGIIGTVLLVLALLAVMAFVAFVVALPSGISSV